MVNCKEEHGPIKTKPRILAVFVLEGRTAVQNHFKNKELLIKEICSWQTWLPLWLDWTGTLFLRNVSNGNIHSRLWRSDFILITLLDTAALDVKLTR